MAMNLISSSKLLLMEVSHNDIIEAIEGKFKTLDDRALNSCCQQPHGGKAQLVLSLESYIQGVFQTTKERCPVVESAAVKDQRGMTHIRELCLLLVVQTIFFEDQSDIALKRQHFDNI
jgi:hypothetical protein